jgi:formamidopyrimidine-DNA glycosylase
MPELPEVETVCRTLAPRVVGKTVRSCSIYWDRTVSPHEPAEFERLLLGRQITGVSRRAKLIVFELDNGNRLSIHLRMTGKLLSCGNDGVGIADIPRDHLRALITFDDASELRFYDARKFGRMRIHTPSEWKALDVTFGREPLDPSFTAARFHDLISTRARQIKPLLLDQSVIAGIGNIYADEALFKARIHPRQPATSLSRKQCGALHAAIVQTLTTAIEHQGTTLRDYRTGHGEPGTNQTELLVYGAPPGTPCPRCGTILEKLVVGQRGTTICPRCQRLKVPVSSRTNHR